MWQNFHSAVLQMYQESKGSLFHLFYFFLFEESNFKTNIVYIFAYFPTIWGFFFMIQKCYQCCVAVAIAINALVVIGWTYLPLKQMATTLS